MDDHREKLDKLLDLQQEGFRKLREALANTTQSSADRIAELRTQVALLKQTLTKFEKIIDGAEGEKSIDTRVTSLENRMTNVYWVCGVLFVTVVTQLISAIFSQLTGE